MKLLFASILLVFCMLSQAAEPRFDEVYFFQSEKALLEKQVNFEDVARFSRKMQSNVWNALKKAKMPVSSGYLVVAVRADGAVAAWLDMEPALHEYYDNEVVQAAMKTPPFAVAEGSVSACRAHVRDARLPGVDGSPRRRDRRVRRPSLGLRRRR